MNPGYQVPERPSRRADEWYRSGKLLVLRMGNCPLKRMN